MNYIINENFKSLENIVNDLLNRKQIETITVKGLGTMPINEVVYLGLISEMGYPSFNIEAYKAQAVAIRTFIETNKKHDGDGFGLCGTVHCFAIADEDKINKFTNEQLERFKRAVKETGDELIYYDNEPIKTPVFFAYGHNTTNLPSDVWSSDDAKYPYLKRVDTFEKVEPQIIEYSKQEFLNRLNIESLEDVKIKQVNLNGYVREIEINGNIFQGNKLRPILGLKSGNFSLYDEGDKIKIICYGYGHGVGMSQYGANELAKMGYNYKGILKHYYQGVDIK